MRLVVLALIALTAFPASALPRVFLAPLRATGVEPGISDLVGDQLLVSARRHKELYDVVGAADVKGILDVEAARAALGCETDSCANEVADALDADQLLTGQLGHVGEVWLLTLTRTDRKTMAVLSRASIEARGESPEVLLSQIPHVVDEALGVERQPNLWAIGGGAVAGVGVLALATGGGLYWLSFAEFDRAKLSLEAAPPDVGSATEARSNSQVSYWGALIVGLSGSALVVVGGGAAIAAIAMEE